MSAAPPPAGARRAGSPPTPPPSPSGASSGLAAALRVAFAWSAALSALGLLVAMIWLPPVMTDLYATFDGALPPWSARMFAPGWRWLCGALVAAQVAAAARKAPVVVTGPLLAAQAALGVAFGVAAALPLAQLPMAVAQE